MKWIFEFGLLMPSFYVRNLLRLEVLLPPIYSMKIMHGPTPIPANLSISL
ncbi:hypothetical protein SVI_1178 [Shewanella violacea DSS12]|uniref:Uncharacterized protein n=1 Tax=Shewanella violacea (strain JCM 10179 / CIP 106290 / LMG 19151 / DSS12) TaxID=637905 RepID=D4ZHK0_SHEVD|nr:hypothetical protein SVI_1178 [Shewanella violacea DSS12]